MAYSKLHSSLVNSSLWTEPDHVRLLFITLLALCDKDGCVYGSRPGLERAAFLDPDVCSEQNPWDVLLSPDKHSSDKMRAPENEGRRIEEIPGGFRLLNFAYYRGLRNEDDRREQNRIAQEKFRNRSKPRSAKVSPDNPPKAHTEAEAEAEASVHTPSKSVEVEKPSLKEVLLFSDKIGLAAWKAEDWFNEMETCGWLDYNHRPIEKWRPALTRIKVKWEADGRPYGPPSAKPLKPKGPVPATNFGVKATTSFRP